MIETIVQLPDSDMRDCWYCRFLEPFAFAKDALYCKPFSVSIRERRRCEACLEGQKELERLRRLDGLLKEIEEHPHIYPFNVPEEKRLPHPFRFNEQMAHAMGHRCCAEIARRRKYNVTSECVEHQQ